jgi:sortase (surface protein transpeptidase)
VAKAAPSTTTTEPAVAANVDLAGDPTSAPARDTSPPTEITIPSIGVHTAVVRLGRNADGTAQVPTTTKVVGWYTGGPVPGQPGPAVILGHVDSYQGPGVFFDLKDIRPGALVEVQEGARTVDFAVQGVSIYTKAAFPTAAVYGPEPDRALRLVTCGGPFDYSTGHYLDNIVAYATEVSNRPS